MKTKLIFLFKHFFFSKLATLRRKVEAKAKFFFLFYLTKLQEPIEDLSPPKEVIDTSKHDFNDVDEEIEDDLENTEEEEFEEEDYLDYQEVLPKNGKGKKQKYQQRQQLLSSDGDFYYKEVFAIGK